jgi:metal-responsive CopG/Arc/MetJ family transcriptional regulator
MPGVKTAISLEKELFSKINQLAGDLRISRSMVFKLAVQDFIQKQENQALLLRLNQAYEDLPAEDESISSKAMRSKHKKLIEKELW